MAKQIESMYGHTVEVSHSISVTKEHLHLLILRAVCGKTSVERRVMIGRETGKKPLGDALSTELLQSILDRHRMIVANDASWKERVRENIKGIQ